MAPMKVPSFWKEGTNYEQKLLTTFLFGLSACSSHDTSSSNTKNGQETSFG